MPSCSILISFGENSVGNRRERIAVGGRLGRIGDAVLSSFKQGFSVDQVPSLAAWSSPVFAWRGILIFPILGRRDQITTPPASSLL